MNPCNQYRTLLVAKAIGKIDPKEDERLAIHLTTCHSCRAALSDFNQILQKIGSAQRPEMPDHFWEGYWDRLVTRMEKSEVPVPFFERVRRSLLWRPAIVMRVAAAMALLLAGILIGRVFWPTERTIVAVRSPVPVARVGAELMEKRSQQLLERSKILLLGIANEDLSAASSADFEPQQQLSRKLISEVRALKTDLGGTENYRLVQLLDQLELVFLHVANLELEQDLEGVELVRDGIDREGLLLKINIEELSRSVSSTRQDAGGRNRML